MRIFLLKKNLLLQVLKESNILGRANPDYRGQGKFHEDSGVIVAAELANGTA